MIQVIFETYGDEVNYIIVHDAITRYPGGKIIIKGTKKLKAELSAEEICQYKRTVYEFSQYLLMNDRLSSPLTITATLP